jgi:hypothetical protein
MHKISEKKIKTTTEATEITKFRARVRARARARTYEQP